MDEEEEYWRCYSKHNWPVETEQKGAGRIEARDPVSSSVSCVVPKGACECVHPLRDGGLGRCWSVVVSYRLSTPLLRRHREFFNGTGTRLPQVPLIHAYSTLTQHTHPHPMSSRPRGQAVVLPSGRFFPFLSHLPSFSQPTNPHLSLHPRPTARYHHTATTTATPHA